MKPAVARDFVRYSRQTLYEEAWSQPMVQLAKKYGISDVALAKTCRSMGIPLPGRGYWAKKKAGIQTRRPALPPVPEGKREEIVVERSADPTPAPGRTLRAKIKQRAKQEVSHKKSVQSVHPLVKATIDHLRTTSVERDGRRLPASEKVLNVRVSEAGISRAGRILVSLVQNLEAHGYRINIEPSGHDWLSFVYVGQLKFEFWLREKVKREPHVLTPKEARLKELGRYVWAPSFDFIPLDEFELSIGSSRYPKVRWADSDSRSLEEQLGEFVAALSVLAEEARDAEIRAAEAARQAQVREAEARRRAEEERVRQQKIEVRRKAEEARVQELLRQTKAWRENRDLRTFIEAVEAAAGDVGLGDTPLLKDWIAWASSIADRSDPNGDPAAMLSRWAEGAPPDGDD